MLHAEQLQDKREAVKRAELAMVESLRLELGKLKVSMLRRRALAAGIHEDACDAANDDDDPKAAFVELIIHHSKSSKSNAPNTDSAAPPSRLVSVKEDFRVIVSTKWSELNPGHSLVHELRSNAGIRASVNDINTIVTDVLAKSTELKFGPALPAGLTEDGLAALVAYTHDMQTGKREGNLYFELNASLRARGIEQRVLMMKVWGSFMFFVMSAMAVLPTFKGVVFRGYPDKAEVIGKYKMVLVT